MPEFCPEEGCGFQVVQAIGFSYCPACGWTERPYPERKEGEHVELSDAKAVG